MYHKSNIRLVYAHAKGYGSTYNLKNQYINYY